MTTWEPDTCDCMINMEKEEFMRRCKLHDNSEVAEVIEHNRGFNRGFNKVMTVLNQNDPEYTALILSKEKEKQRIRDL